MKMLDHLQLHASICFVYFCFVSLPPQRSKRDFKGIARFLEMPGVLGLGTFAGVQMKLVVVQSLQTLLLLGGVREANISSCLGLLSHLLCVLGLLADLRLIRSALTPTCTVTRTKSEYRNGTAWPVKTRLIWSRLRGGVAKTDDRAYIHIFFNAHCGI